MPPFVRHYLSTMSGFGGVELFKVNQFVYFFVLIVYVFIRFLYLCIVKTTLILLKCTIVKVV